MNLSEYRSAIRHMTRLTSLTDAEIDREVNSVKDALFSIAPFHIETEHIDSRAYDDTYVVEEKSLSRIIVVSYYPFLSTELTAGITPSDTTLTVENTSGFPSSGFLLLESGDLIEVVSYSGKTGTTFTGLVRGQEGTSALSFLEGSYVRYWAHGAKWEHLDALTETTLFEERKLESIALVTQPDSIKRYYTYAGYSLYILPPPRLNSSGSIRVVGFHKPPDLIFEEDTIKGFPTHLDRLLVLYASRNVWLAYGGEDNFRRLQATDGEFGLLLGLFKDYVEYYTRGLIAAVKAHSGRRSGGMR